MRTHGEKERKKVREKAAHAREEETRSQGEVTDLEVRRR